MLQTWFPDLFPIRDPILIFAIVLVLFLLSPIVMGRIRLPSMIGLLLAGAVLGPHATGVLARDSSFVLLGAVGLIYIMFTAALEVDLGVFRKYGLQGAVYGFLTFIIPQGLGTAFAYYVLGFDWLAALLLASMIASHTLLAYPLVSRLGLASRPSVTATLGGTMVTDTAALLVLAIIAGMAEGEVNEAFWWRLGVSITLYVGIILFGLPRLGRWFFRRVAKDGPAQFVFVLTSVFLCAAASHAAGLEPIVGAFLAGVALNSLIPHNGALMNRLTFTGEAIFIPFFLLSVGMLLDVRVLFGGWETLAIGFGLTATVIAAKWLAAHAARIIFRYSKPEGQVMFGLSVVQAAATLATVMVGHRIGLFNDAVVNGSIITILVTCVLGPWVVQKYAPAMAAAAAATEPPKPAAAGGILLPLASAEQADAMVEFSLLLRSHGGKERLYPAFVAADDPQLARTLADGAKVLTRAVAQASAAEWEAEPIKRVGTAVGQTLVAVRKELAVDQVVVPWDGAPSQSGEALGSVVGALVSDPEAQVFLCRLPHALGSGQRLVVFVPSETISAADRDAALAVVQKLAKELGTPVALVCPEPVAADLKAGLGTSSDLRVEVLPYPQGRTLVPMLKEKVRDSDFLLVLATRPSAAGSEELLHLPARIVSGFPKNNVVALFPGKMSAAVAAPSPTEPAVADEQPVAAAG